jgi:hypothetical protein
MMNTEEEAYIIKQHLESLGYVVKKSPYGLGYIVKDFEEKGIAIKIKGDRRYLLMGNKWVSECENLQKIIDTVLA